MSKSEAYRCAKYVQTNSDRLLLVGPFIIDVEALLTLCNLDCFRCQLVHRETCCENGQPYAVEDWQIPLIEREAAHLVENYERHGIWDAEKPTGTLRLNRGSCVFYMDGKECRVCGLHAHALATEQEVYSLKPISCQLYPIDLIEIGENILITALTEETAPFSRWGFDYLDDFYCSNLERRKQATHIDESHFAIAEYAPAYLWGKEVITNALGPAAYQAVEQAIQLHHEKNHYFSNKGDILYGSKNM